MSRSADILQSGDRVAWRGTGPIKFGTVYLHTGVNSTVNAVVEWDNGTMHEVPIRMLRRLSPLEQLAEQAL